MQLYALDSENCVKAASQAEKQCDYFCIECGKAVRLRGGVHRQKHFFHSSPTQQCKLSGKSMRHLQVQWCLQELFIPGEIRLEQRFSEIQRIADAVWISRKIVFEVQCSFIRAEEVEARNRDYASLGYQVLWILHESLYNKKRMTAAELFLHPRPHYFTDIDSRGNGIIYDQLSHIVKGVRQKSSEKVSVFLPDSYEIPQRVKTPLPHKLQERLLWPFYFKGDVLDLCLNDTVYLSKCLQLEKTWMPKKQDLWSWCLNKMHYYLVRPYKIIFQLLLEKASH